MRSLEVYGASLLLLCTIDMFSYIDLQKINRIETNFSLKNPLSLSEKDVTSVIYFVTIKLIYEALFQQWYSPL